MQAAVQRVRGRGHTHGAAGGVRGGRGQRRGGGPAGGRCSAHAPEQPRARARRWRCVAHAAFVAVPHRGVGAAAYG